jgi:CheY-like chemotaxis protein
MDAIVLVVEDETLIRLDIADCLAEAGFDTLEAANADQAIRTLENRPDIRLILTDVNMPGKMIGLELAALVRLRWPPIKNHRHFRSLCAQRARPPGRRWVYFQAVRSPPQ